MRRNLAAIASVLICLGVRGQIAQEAKDPPYEIVSVGPHERVWSKTVIDSQGNTNVHSYAEIASGLNFWDPATQAWRESQELLQIAGNGYAIATNGQNKLSIAPDIATAGGAIDFLAPDGIHLLSSPRAIVFHDKSSDSAAVIAEVTNCVGELSLPNVVIFPSAFDSARIAIGYTYTRAGVAQDLIFYRRLPSKPSDFNFSEDSTVLEIWTEFLQASSPAITPSSASSDQTLDFGATHIGPGFAYVQESQDLQRVPVEKSWVETNGQRFLVESIKWSKLKPLLDTLQASVSSTNKTQIARTFPSRIRLIADGLARTTRSALVASIHPGHMPSERGVVADYQTLTTSLTNFVAAAASTYFISGPVLIVSSNSGPALTLEGGCCLKFTNDTGAGISLNGALACKTAPFRMAILTSWSDNSVGEQIGSSTGSPTNYNGASFLTGTAGVYQYLRFCYAGTAFTGDGRPAKHSFSHSQFVQCGTAIRSLDTDTDLHNVLFANCGTVLSFSKGDDVLTGEHVTADQITTFINRTDDTGLLTNSILTAVSGSLSNVSLYNCITNSSGAGIFQSAAAGNYYLATSSTNRNAGTTNISVPLLADLKRKTTYPPIIYSNITISTNMTLAPQAQRETAAAPDIGFGYDWVDYLTYLLAVTNAALSIAPGTSIACYNWTGILLQEGSSINSVGTPLAPNWLVSYQGVQEQPLALGGSTASWSVNAYHTNSPAPTGIFRFTRFICSPGGGNQFYDSSWSFGTLLLRDSEIWGGVSKLDGAANTSQTLVNNLFYRGTCLSSASVTNSLAVSNNLFWSVTSLELKPANSNLWSAYNNEFDSCSFFVVPGTIVNSGYNAYWNCNKQLNPTNASDLTLSSGIAYQPGPLGDFYQPTNSPLVNTGSCTADLAGLYHHTVSTSIVNGAEVRETNSVVDCGLHYLAVDTSGRPIDTDGDSIPDYAEDTNGNGVFDAGDFGDWTRFLYNKASFAGINNNTNRTNRPDTMGAIGPSHFVETLNGAVAIYAKTNGAQLAYTNAEDFFRVTANSGSYAGYTYPDPQNPSTFAGDPRVLFDHASQRWFACALDFVSGHALLAVSKTSDPVGAGGATWVVDQWTHYLVPMGPNPTNGYYSDYDRLGVDGNGVYIVVIAEDNGKERFAALPKGPFLDGSATTVQTNFIFDGAAPFTSQPAVSFDAIATNDPAWFISPTSNTSPAAAIYYNRLTWTNGPTSPPAFDSEWGQLSVDPSYTDVYHVMAPQNDLNPITPAPMTAMVSKINGTQYLWACRQVAVNSAGNNNSSNADRSAIEWFKILTTPSVSIVDKGRIFDTNATNFQFYYYPSLAVNTNGDMVIGFSGSSTNTGSNGLIAAYYWGKLNNGSSSITPVRYFGATTNYSTHTAINGGDYSYTSLDPTDRLTIWTIQMYAETNLTANGYVWGTAFCPVSPY